MGLWAWKQSCSSSFSLSFPIVARGAERNPMGVPALAGMLLKERSSSADN
jgi:hypothetical protein